MATKPKGKAPVATPAKPAPAKVVATPEMVVVHPEFGEITVGELIKKVQEKKATSPGLAKKKEIAAKILAALWPVKMITASTYNETVKKVKEAENTTFAPSLGFLEVNGWLIKVPVPGARPFYTITKEGAAYAKIDTTKLPELTTPGEVKEAAAEVAEFIEEKEEK